VPHWSELPPSDQIFTHFDGESATRIERTFAASRLRALCEQPGSALAGVAHVEVPIDPGFLQVLAQCRGLERARLQRALTMPRYAPLLFCLLGKGADASHLLVDGSHTYAAMVLRGQKTARAWVVPECLWRSHLVTGLPSTTPEELLATPSYCGRARL
jgi:hypothetical protein